MSKAVVIFSGGQDSLTCLYWAKKNYNEVHAITFKYGQNHNVEIEQAIKVCEMEGIPHVVVDLTFIPFVVNSALLNKGDVNTLNEKGLPSSFVPNRNQLFITVAHAYAQKVKATHLVTGVCQTDYSGYPDCRADFITLIQEASNLGSNSAIRIVAPLMYATKAATFQMAKDLDVLDEVIEHSHTCYNGDRQTKNEWGYGCGKCPACVLREKGWEEFQCSTAD